MLLVIGSILAMVDALLWAPNRCRTDIVTTYGDVPVNRCKELMGSFTCRTADYEPGGTILHIGGTILGNGRGYLMSFIDNSFLEGVMGSSRCDEEQVAETVSGPVTF